jgi:hypothetical protein
MITSQTSILSKPIPGQQVSAEAFAYMRARARRHAYDLVMSEFKKSGITKAELARRLFGDKGADRVSRMLGGPGNWTIKTVSDLLFAISGAEPTYGIAYPLDKPRRNFTGYSKYLTDVQTSSPENVVVETKDVEVQSTFNEVLIKQVELVE